MSELEKAARQAMDALERTVTRLTDPAFITSAITALRAALDQQQAEPVAFFKRDGWVLRDVLFDDGEPTAHRQPEKYAEPVADAVVRHAARAMSNHDAQVCGINAEDLWRIHSDVYVDEARVALQAARNFKEAT
jgi:hypothetical protein